MAISVLFPDGSYSKVPAQLVMRKAGEELTFSKFRQAPLNCDPLWWFFQDDGVWRAKLRHGPDVKHFPAREELCWWEGIPQICGAMPETAADGAILKTAA
jgi:hypothetical protein